MHVLHYIAVEAQDKEEATEFVNSNLETTLEEGAPWYDWFVTGGGRFTAETTERAYEDTSYHTLSYVDDSLRFYAVLKERQRLRLEQFKERFERVNETKLKDIIQSYLSEGSEAIGGDRLTVYNYIEMLKTINGYWTPDSYFYDLVSYDTEIDDVKERIKNNPNKQFLVPVDFHF